MSELLPSDLVENEQSARMGIKFGCTRSWLGRTRFLNPWFFPAMSLSKQTLKVRFFVFPHAPKDRDGKRWHGYACVVRTFYEMTLDRKVDMENIDESCCPSGGI